MLKEIGDFCLPCPGRVVFLSQKKVQGPYPHPAPKCTAYPEFCFAPLEIPKHVHLLGGFQRINMYIFKSIICTMYTKSFGYLPEEGVEGRTFDTGC